MGLMDKLKETSKQAAQKAVDKAQEAYENKKQAKEEKQQAKADAALAKQQAKEESLRKAQEFQEAQAELADIFKATKDLVQVAFDDVNKLIRVKPNIFAPPFIFPYSYVKGYELIEDGAQVSGGGLGAAVVGGVLFGGVGAITGSVVGRKKSRATVDNLTLQINTNDLQNPIVSVQYIATSTKISSLTYRVNSENARATAAILDLIVEQANSVVQQKPDDAVIVEVTDAIDPYDEIKKLKELLDLGIVSEEEFNQKKNELLGL